MIPVTDKTIDKLNMLAALLWIFLVIASWSGVPWITYCGLVSLALLGVIYFILGTTIKGNIGVPVPLVYPILIMALLWIIAFTVAYTTRGQHTERWIIGMHPGQFWTLLFFWFGSFLTSMVSYVMYFDSYLLPEDEWKSFLREVEKMKAIKGKSNE
ncbi:hypothetical protein ACFL47_05080 [Candidatus Latescibacterota bacterium]